MDDNTALAFNTICNFIRDLNDSFGTRQKSLLLYGHLIEKTGLIHMEPVKKHLQIFRSFVQTNDEAIQARDKKKLKLGRISYSDKVAIDLQSIFQMADREEEKVIWVHLLTISAILHPEGHAKQTLKEMKNSGRASSGCSSGGEDNFLKNMMDKIGEQIQSNDGQDVNPMQMIGSLMSSGVFSELFQGLSSGMSDGNMDIGKMMGSMQGLLNNLNTMVGENAVKTDESPVSASASTATITPDAIENTD